MKNGTELPLPPTACMGAWIIGAAMGAAAVATTAIGAVVASAVRAARTMERRGDMGLLRV